MGPHAALQRHTTHMISSWAAGQAVCMLPSLRDTPCAVAERPRAFVILPPLVVFTSCLLETCHLQGLLRGRCGNSPARRMHMTSLRS